MALITKLISSLIAVAFLAAVGFGLYLLGAYAFERFGTVDPLLALVVAVGVSIAFVLAHGIRRSGIAAGTERLRLERRAAAYAGFLSAVRSPMSAGNRGAAIDVALWASGTVLRQVATWRDGKRRAEDLAPLLRAMRADLGQSNLGFKASDLTTLLDTPASMIQAGSEASILRVPGEDSVPRAREGRSERYAPADL